jgi:hypothetical protein
MNRALDSRHSGARSARWSIRGLGWAALLKWGDSVETLVDTVRSNRCGGGRRFRCGGSCGGLRRGRIAGFETLLPAHAAARLQSAHRQHSQNESADQIRAEVQRLSDDHRRLPNNRLAHGNVAKARPAPRAKPFANPAAATK